MRPDLEDDPMGQYEVRPACDELAVRYDNAEPESDELDAVHAENLANARLISAAPKLLAACKGFVAWIEGHAEALEHDGYDWQVILREGNAAIQSAASTSRNTQPAASNAVNHP